MHHGLIIATIRYTASWFDGIGGGRCMAVSEKQDSNLLCPDGEGVTTLAHLDV